LFLGTWIERQHRVAVHHHRVDDVIGELARILATEGQPHSEAPRFGEHRRDRLPGLRDVVELVDEGVELVALPFVHFGTRPDGRPDTPEDGHPEHPLELLRLAAHSNNEDFALLDDFLDVHVGVPEPDHAAGHAVLYPLLEPAKERLQVVVLELCDVFEVVLDEVDARGFDSVVELVAGFWGLQDVVEVHQIQVSFVGEPAVVLVHGANERAEHAVHSGTPVVASAE